VTIGCIPVGDEAIEEIFYVTARTGISKTDIVISPYDMRKGRDCELERSVTNKIMWMSGVYDNIYNELENYK
jgi:hypothetical protein